MLLKRPIFLSIIAINIPHLAFIRNRFTVGTYSKCKHLHTNNILVTEQYGFSEGTSTEDAASIAYSNLLTKKHGSVYQKMHVGGILCD